MKELGPTVIHKLRVMAGEHRLIAEMVRAILPERQPNIEGTFEVVRLFRAAFDLTLPEAKPIADWLVYGGGEQPDSDLHQLVWPPTRVESRLLGIEESHRFIISGGRV